MFIFENMGGLIIAVQDLPLSLQSPLFEAFSESIDKQYIYICDVKTNIWRWSANAVSYFGLLADTIENLPEIWLAKVHPEDRERTAAAFGDLFSGASKTHSCEYRIKNAQGNYVWVLCRGCMVYDDDGSMKICAGVITPLGQNNKFDAVTGLMSHHEFKSALEKRTSGSANHFCILLLGIDHFRRINDLNNYAFGNIVLMQYAKRLVDIIPVNCHVYKMDGDKFAFIYENADKNDIELLFASASTSAQNGVTANGCHICFTVSAGAVFFPDDCLSADELYTSMEHALEYSKNNSRESLTYFTADLKQETVMQYRFRQALKESIQNNFAGFDLYYQPTVSADETHRLIGAEALLRWRHPEFGLVSPATFIPILEDTGKIIEVGKWVVATALKQVNEWLCKKPDIKISVNVSLIQFLEESFREFVLNEIEQYNFPKNQLVLELTESCNVIQPETVRRELDFFREKGIEIALDDFGTGYASLSILRDIAADWIKVDHSFVKQIAHNEFDQALTETLIDLCKKLNLRVCVEGIETEEIKNVIQSYNPMTMQGYLFSRPISREQFEREYILC